ncbi:MAG: SET domain-containing protein [Pseudomonadota bacterium]
MGVALKVAKSKIHGNGLFAKEVIKKGKVLGFCKTKKTKKITDHTLWLGEKLHMMICDFRFINHDKKPNVIIYDDLSVVALKKIKKGEELTHHYGDDWK